MWRGSASLLCAHACCWVGRDWEGRDGGSLEADTALHGEVGVLLQHLLHILLATCQMLDYLHVQASARSLGSVLRTSAKRQYIACSTSTHDSRPLYNLS